MSRDQCLVPTPSGRLSSGYVVYLPGDDDDLSEGGGKARRVLSEALGNALRRTNEAFWSHVAREGAYLAKSVDTYLQFKTRAFDSEGTHDGVSTRAASTLADDELGRRVFMTLLRLVNDGTRERTSISEDERTRLIVKFGLIDVVKLIDAAVLYGKENPELVHELFEGAKKLLPTLMDDFSRAGKDIDENLYEMTSRITSASMRDEISTESIDEILLYVLDVAFSLFSLQKVYPEAWDWISQCANLRQRLDSIRTEVLPSFRPFMDDPEGLNALQEKLDAIVVGLQGSDSLTVAKQGATNDEYVGIPPASAQVIQGIRTIFPDLGIGFAKACVDHYGLNAELIVQNLFENSLPVNLSMMDRKLGWPPHSVRSLGSSGQNSVVRPTPKDSTVKSGYYLARKVNREVDLEHSAADKRAMMAMLELEYEDEYDDSFDDLPVSNISLSTEDVDANAGSNGHLRATKSTFYVIDGKVYNAPRDNAQKILAVNAEEASRIAIADEKSLKSEIEGLGAGGNKARFAPDFIHRAQDKHANNTREMGPESSGKQGHGSGRVTGGRATRGLTAKDFAHKHHNQKAKAAKKHAI